MKINKMKFSKYVEENQVNYWDNEFDWEKLDKDAFLLRLLKWMKDGNFEKRFKNSLKYYKPSGKVLDIGAGSLWASALFSNIESVTEVHAVEISENRLKYEGIPLFNKLNGNKNKAFLHTGDAHKLDFQDNYFDVIFCDGVLHHLDNLKYGLQEINRMLKPNGHLVVLREPVIPTILPIKRVIPKDDFNLQIMNIEYWRYNRQYIYEISLNGFDLIKTIHYSEQNKIKGIKIPKFFLFPPFAKVSNLILVGENSYIFKKVNDIIGGVPTNINIEQ